MKEKFYQAWWFLVDHPKFKDKRGLFTFEQSLVIEVVKVNPKTKRIDDDEKLNTLVQTWLECGKYEKTTKQERELGMYADGKHVHDIRLDTGGDTFEIAIIRLARLVKRYYGTYEAEL